MAVPKVYHYPGCSTCKKAVRWLKEQGVEHVLVDIVASPPSVTTLRKAQALAGVPVKKLFNVSGNAYRAGGFKDRLPDMSDAQAHAALAADGMLIKRPLVVGEQVALIGFREAAWTEALG